MKPILMAPRMAVTLRNTKCGTWPAQPIDPEKPFKWQTRRAVKPMRHPYGEMLSVDDVVSEFTYDTGAIRCPYGQPGGKLYVKENYKYYDWTEEGEPFIEYIGGDVKLKEPDSDEWAMKLMDIWADLSSNSSYVRAADRKWRPSIYMPRWASRTHLEITGIRVERLRDISEADAIAEGFESKEEFLRYYAERNKKSPAANPLVWVLEFRRIA